MKDHTDLKIALAILIPSFLIGAALVVMIHPVHAASDSNQKCDESDLERNDQGNNKGNPHCVGDFRFDDGNSNEPTRDCFGGNRDNNGVDGQGLHKQALDDHDGDGVACVTRGNND